MPRLVKERKCFNCGDPAPATVSKLKPPALARHICMAEKCWAAWRTLSEK